MGYSVAYSAATIDRVLCQQGKHNGDDELFLDSVYKSPLNTQTAETNVQATTSLRPMTRLQRRALPEQVQLEQTLPRAAQNFSPTTTELLYRRARTPDPEHAVMKSLSTLSYIYGALLPGSAPIERTQHSKLRTP